MNTIENLYNLDTAELSDALDSLGIEGALVNISQVTPGVKMVGIAYTVKYEAYQKKPANFKNAGNYIDDVPKNSVIIIDNDARRDCTIWGDILTRVALKSELAGTVINGAIRDAEYIKRNNYPVFSSSIFMRSGKNRVYKSSQQCELVIGEVAIRPGDFIVGDDNGVICIPQNIVEDVINRANNIKATEEAIIKSISEGSTLLDARKKYRYDQPWLDSSIGEK